MSSEDAFLRADAPKAEEIAQFFPILFLSLVVCTVFPLIPE
jgi:hypothetical protein